MTKKEASEWEEFANQIAHDLSEAEELQAYVKRQLAEIDADHSPNIIVECAAISAKIMLEDCEKWLEGGE